MKVEPNLKNRTKLDSGIHSTLISDAQVINRLAGSTRMVQRRDTPPLVKGRWALAVRKDEIPYGVLGVYVVYDATIKALVYVGQGEVQSRTEVWFKKRMNYYVKWRPAKWLGEHLAAEFRLIWKLQPELNQKGIYKERRPLATRLTKAQIEVIRERIQSERLSKGRKKRIQDILELRRNSEEEIEQLEASLGFSDVLPSPPKE